ncbi:MAG TPA: magnesium transporter [Actinomycetota bacterium]|jgi:mgtE-like transporter
MAATSRATRLVPRPARRLYRSWRAEKRTLRQGLVALTLSTAASFVAGLILASITHTLSALPGLLVLIPAAVGMRGTIFGAIGARLGTASAAGTFETNLKRGGVLAQNVEVAFVTTFTSSLWLAALAKVATSAFGESSISFWDLVTISVVGGFLGSVLILLVTLLLSVVSYRRGYDLDSVATPMVTALGDMGTLPLLYLATFLTRNDALNAIVAGLCIVVTVLAVVRMALRGDPGVRRIVLEMTAVIALTPFLDIAAGALLQAKEPLLARLPALYILIPPFVSQAGALGGILSSRLSSKLQLGVITNRGLPERPAVVDGSIVVLLGLAIFALIGVVGFGLAAVVGQPGPSAADTIGGTFLAGLLVMPLILVVGYYLAVLTSRFGLDPDNHAVPIITSVLDLAGVVALLLAMSLSGVALNG